MSADKSIGPKAVSFAIIVIDVVVHIATGAQTDASRLSDESHSKHGHNPRTTRLPDESSSLDSPRSPQPTEARITSGTLHTGTPGPHTRLPDESSSLDSPRSPQPTEARFG